MSKLTTGEQKSRGAAKASQKSPFEGESDFVEVKFRPDTSPNHFIVQCLAYVGRIENKICIHPTQAPVIELYDLATSRRLTHGTLQLESVEPVREEDFVAANPKKGTTIARSIISPSSDSPGMYKFRFGSSQEFDPFPGGRYRAVATFTSTIDSYLPLYEAPPESEFDGKQIASGQAEDTEKRAKAPARVPNTFLGMLSGECTFDLPALAAPLATESASR